MSLRSRIAALVKRHQAGMVERIGRMGSDERVALVRRMFADRAEQAGPEHGQSLADGLGELCRQRNYEYLRVEGYAAGQWILVDLNDIVVNVFLEPVRELYGLEALWGGAAASGAHSGE